MTSLRGLFSVAFVLAALACVGGCRYQIGGQGRGALTIESRDRQALNVAETFPSGYYSIDDSNTVTMVLVSGDPDNPSAALTVRMFWRPEAGLTAVDRTATNSTVQLVVFGTSMANQTPAQQAGDVGLYSGAGFVYANNAIGVERLRAGIWEANLLLSDRSEDFTDLLGPSIMSGSVRATRDDARVTALLDRLTKLTSDRLGYPRLVRAE